MTKEADLGKQITLTMATSFFKKVTTNNLFDFWDQQIEAWSFTKRPNTIKSYKSTLNIVNQFDSKLNFGDLSYSKIQKFDVHMSKVRGNSTGGKFTKHKCFKAIINEAIKHKLINESPYKDFKYKAAKGTRQYLTIAQVKELVNFEIVDGQANLHLVKDLFLFSCYTGMRFSDVAALKNENINISAKRPYLEIGVIKTSRHQIVPLTKSALELIEKHANLEAAHKGKLVFPSIANQTCNRGLKDIMKMMEIDKHITFHCGRHTFASNHVEAKTPIVLIKELLGHKNLTETQIYAQATTEDLFKSMEIMDDKYSL